MVLRAKQFVNHGNTVLHCDARINGRGERRFFDYVGSNFQLQMACQGFSGPLHTTIVADPEFKPFDLQGLRAEHPSVQSFRPTRPGCLRPKGRTPFPTGKVTIAEAAARFGPQLECPVDGFAPRYASRLGPWTKRKQSTFSFGNGVPVAIEQPFRFPICHGATFDISIRVFQASPSRTRIANQ